MKNSIQLDSYNEKIQRIVLESYNRNLSKQEKLDLIEIFNEIASLHSNELDPSNKLEAAIYYQYIIQIYKSIQIDNAELQELYKKKIAEIGVSLTEQGNFSIWSETDKDSYLLTKIRESSYIKITDSNIMEQSYDRNVNEDLITFFHLRSELLSSRAELIYSNTTQMLKEMLAYFFESTEKYMQIQAPCKYAIVALGSMALGQTTPYSDMEFAILVEKTGYEKYFQKLTSIVCLRIINLGETSIPYNKHHVDLDFLIKKGFSFDLGGKTPLGRKDRDYSLICTVSEMLQYLYNENDTTQNIDKNLPYILENTSFVFGDEPLYLLYDMEKNKFLSKKVEEVTYSHQRAVRKLQEFTLSYGYSTNAEVSGDLKKYAPILTSPENMGRTYDIKNEIYRTIERFIVALASLYNINTINPWETIKSLAKENKLSKNAALNLQNALSFALISRLRTYFYYRAQKEDVDFEVLGDASAEEDSPAPKTYKIDTSEKSDFFRYYYTIIPFIKKIAEYVSASQNPFFKRNASDFFLNDSYYNNSNAITAQIYSRLQHHNKARKFYEQACLTEPSWENQYFLAENLLDASLYKEALAKYLELKDIFEKEDMPYERKVIYRKDLALLYYETGDYKTSENIIEALEKEVEEKIEASAKLKIISCSIKHNISILYCAQGHYSRALIKAQESYDRRINTGASPYYVASSMEKIGICHLKLGNYLEAEKSFKKAFDILSKLYKSKNHETIARNFYYIGEVNTAQHLHKEALIYYREAYSIIKKIYPNSNHQFIARLTVRLADIANILGDREKAVFYIKEAIEIAKIIQNEIELSFANITAGLIYINLGEFHEAEKHMDESCRIRRNIYKENGFSQVLSFTYTRNADVKYLINKNDEAKKLYLDALTQPDYQNHKIYCNFILAIIAFKEGKYQQAYDSLITLTNDEQIYFVSKNILGKIVENDSILTSNKAEYKISLQQLAYYFIIIKYKEFEHQNLSNMKSELELHNELSKLNTTDLTNLGITMHQNSPLYFTDMVHNERLVNSSCKTME